MKFILFFFCIFLISTNLDVFGAEQSTRDVGFVNKFIINTDERSFEIIFGANFLISSHTFNVNDKMLQFNIETSLEQENIGEITIPRDLLDGEYIVLLDGEKISHKLSDTVKTSVITVIFDGKGKRTLDITTSDYFQMTSDKPNGGGCLIATAAFGSELAPHVQLLREIRDNTLLQTQSGLAFMNGFNQFYYSFSPAVADYERENQVFKEAVKTILTPLLTSLVLFNYVDIDSEYEMLGYGIGIILLNIGMYFVAPTVLIMKVRKRVNMEKLDKKYA